MPVARSTTPTPPCPSARASVAAHSRRERSVNTGTSAACLARSVANRTRHGTMHPAAGTSDINQLFPDGPLVFTSGAPGAGYIERMPASGGPSRRVMTIDAQDGIAVSPTTRRLLIAMSTNDLDIHRAELAA